MELDISPERKKQKNGCSVAGVQRGGNGGNGRRARAALSMGGVLCLWVEWTEPTTSGTHMSLEYNVAANQDAEQASRGSPPLEL